MIRWLDFLIFGSGHGLAAPYFDQPFYWLTNGNGKRGEFYTFAYGLGAQLYSFGWRRIPAGTERVLSGQRFRIFRSSRRWIRCEHAWAMTLPDDLDAAHTKLREFERGLGRAK